MIPVLYADEHLVIVDKPADLLSVPGKGPDKLDCLWRRVQYQGYPTARIVHRLDYATSGLILLALTPQAQRQLGQLFQQRQMNKTYQAIVAGTLTEPSGRVEAALRCDWERRPLQIVDPEQGKPAITRWEVISQGNEQTRLWLFPETGRSHQLRVHMQWLGHPILGDRFYAPSDAQAAAPRLLLHAQRLKFTHPVSGKVLDISSPVPF